MFIEIIIKSIISIVVLLFLAKSIGGRQISEMSIFDYINGITIGSIAAETAVTDESIIRPLLAMFIYGAVTILLSWLTDKSLIIRRFINGRPYVLFSNNSFKYKNMKKAKVDLFEIMTACREAGYFDISQIHTMIIESNGKISILPKSEYRPATPKDIDIKPEKAYLFADVILEGKIMYDNLKNMGRDENWLRKQMIIHNIKSETEVFLGISDENDNCYFFRKDEKIYDKDVLI